MGLNTEFTLDLSYLDEVSGGNKEFIVEMIDMFVAQTPAQVSQLVQAIENGDYKSIASLAHKIKPTLAFVGVEEIRLAFAEAESSAREQRDLEKIKTSFDNVEQVFEIVVRKLQEKKSEML